MVFEDYFQCLLFLEGEQAADFQRLLIALKNLKIVIICCCPYSFWNFN